MPSDLTKSSYSDYSETISLAKSGLYARQKLKSQFQRSIDKFAFVQTAQWIILFLTNIIGVLFIVFACIWIV